MGMMRSIGVVSGISLGPEAVGVIDMVVDVTVVEVELVAIVGIVLTTLVFPLGAFGVSIPSMYCSGRFNLSLLATVLGVTFPISISSASGKSRSLSRSIAGRCHPLARSRSS